MLLEKDLLRDAIIHLVAGVSDKIPGVAIGEIASVLESDFCRNVFVSRINQFRDPDYFSKENAHDA